MQSSWWRLIDMLPQIIKESPMGTSQNEIKNENVCDPVVTGPSVAPTSWMAFRVISKWTD